MPKEIRFAIRSLFKTPGFSLTAIIALALGIGANTAIWSVANAFLLKPLNLPELGRLAMIADVSPGDDSPDQDDSYWKPIPPADYRDIKSQSQSFEALAAYRREEVNLSGDNHPEILPAALVTESFFQTVESKAQLGRVLSPEASQLGQGREVVLGYELWMRRFGGAADVINKTLRLNSANYVIVGVMPKGFRFPVGASLWLPLFLKTDEMAVRGEHSLRVIARLKPGISASGAGNEMQLFGQSLAKQYPDSHRGWKTHVVPLREYVSGSYIRQYTVLLVCAVLLVLVIACANVANLQFARAISRQKEMAIHGALGASQWRILRQLLTESVVLSLIAGLVALPIGQFSIELILQNMPPEVASYVAGWDNIRLDWEILAFTLLVAALVGILAGIAPAVQSARTNPVNALKEGSRGSSSGSGTYRARVILLAFEIALSAVLLVGAGLMVRGTLAFSTAGETMQPRSVLTVEFAPPDRHASVTFYSRVLQETAPIPGVQSASLSSAIPFNGAAPESSFTIDGRPLPLPGQRNSAALQAVSPGFLEMMHAPLVSGRLIDDRDGPGAPRVAVISRRMAQKLWPNENPLGQHIHFDRSDMPATIIGVTGDLIYDLYDREPISVIYVPYTQNPAPFTYLLVRSAGDPTRLSSAIRKRFFGLAPEQPLSRFITLDTARKENAISLDYVATILTIAGVVAFGLACVGIYGVVAYAVAQRTREIGIRVSLGARGWSVLALVMRQNVIVIAAGLAAGLTASVFLARTLAFMIFGVKALDITVFAGVALLLASVAVLATLIPAWRVLRIEPLLALRSE